MNQRRGSAHLADASHQQRHVGTLPAAVGVQLVEHQEAQPLCCPDEIVLPGPREDQLQHHVVGEEDVWWRGNDLAALLIRLLARVAAKRDRGLAVGVAVAEELLELAELAVGKRVHRIDDDRLNAPPAPSAQHFVNDRDDVGEALAGARARRQNIVVAGGSGAYPLDLMAVKSKQSEIYGRCRFPPEDPQALRMQQALSYEIRKRVAMLKAGVEPQERIRPEIAALKLPLDELRDPGVPDA